jgi:hypothetical protein
MFGLLPRWTCQHGICAQRGQIVGALFSRQPEMSCVVYIHGPNRGPVPNTSGVAIHPLFGRHCVQVARDPPFGRLCVHIVSGRVQSSTEHGSRQTSQANSPNLQAANETRVSRVTKPSRQILGCLESFAETREAVGGDSRTRRFQAWNVTKLMPCRRQNKATVRLPSI